MSFQIEPREHEKRSVFCFLEDCTISSMSIVGPHIPSWIGVRINCEFKEQLLATIARIDAILLLERTKNWGLRQWRSGLGRKHRTKGKNVSVGWMVIAKIKGGKVSPSRKDTKRDSPLHSCPHLLFLAGVKASLLSISNRMIRDPFPSPRFFITIYSRTSGTSSYAALLWPANSPRGRLIGPDFGSRKDIDFKNSTTDGTDTSFQPKVSPLPTNFWIYFTPIESSGNGANPDDGSESMTDLSNIGWICGPRLIGDAKEISQTRCERNSTIFHYGTSIGRRKEKFQSRINPPANARTGRSGQTCRFYNSMQGPKCFGLQSGG